MERVPCALLRRTDRPYTASHYVVELRPGRMAGELNKFGFNLRFSDSGDGPHLAVRELAARECFSHQRQLSEPPRDADVFARG